MKKAPTNSAWVYVVFSSVSIKPWSQKNNSQAKQTQISSRKCEDSQYAQSSEIIQIQNICDTAYSLVLSLTRKSCLVYKITIYNGEESGCLLRLGRLDGEPTLPWLQRAQCGYFPPHSPEGCFAGSISKDS